jgi:hypothetical protein
MGALGGTNAVEGALLTRREVCWEAQRPWRRLRSDCRTEVYWLQTHQILEREEWARSQ